MASIALSPTATAARAHNRWRFALVGLGTIVAAVLGNVLVYALGSAIVGYDAEFLILADVGGAILFTVVPAIVAVLLYAVLCRFTARPALVFNVIAAIVFVVTLLPDLTYIPTLPGATVGQTATLILMHIVAAAIICGMLTTLTRPRGR